MIFKTRWWSKSLGISVFYLLASTLLWTQVATAGKQEDLIKAAEHGDAYELKSIINAGADINAREKKDGLTALMIAAEGGHLAVVQTELVKWMEEHEYESIRQMQGSMSQKSVADPAAFERANYMKALTSFDNRLAY